MSNRAHQPLSDLGFKLLIRMSMFSLFCDTEFWHDLNFFFTILFNPTYDVTYLTFCIF